MAGPWVVNYFQAGLNYYFLKEGKGLYGNLSYGILNAKLTITEIQSNSGTQNNGTAEANISNNSMNIKVGAKWGNVIYFRPEIGYSFTHIDKTLVVNVTYPDGSTETQNETLPTILTQGLLFNIGFGVSF